MWSKARSAMKTGFIVVIITFCAFISATLAEPTNSDTQHSATTRELLLDQIEESQQQNGDGESDVNHKWAGAKDEMNVKHKLAVAKDKMKSVKKKLAVAKKKFKRRAANFKTGLKKFVWEALKEG